MPKRSRKARLPDPAEAAFRIVQAISGESISEPLPDSAHNDKNPAAVAHGRLGGLKGGPARAKKLSKKRLSEIGRKAASSRWGKRKR